MRLTTAGKVTILLLVLGAAFGLYRLFGGDLMAKIAPARQDKGSVAVPKADLPTLGNSSGEGGVAPANLPGSEPGCTEKPEVRFLGYAWNAHMGLLFANGGPQASKGSLMCGNGVNLKFGRQDDNGKLTEALVTFATDLSQGNKNPTKGAHFVTVMGDGSATFLKGANDALKKIGPEYTAKIVGSCGYSRGEDKFMGPAEWKANPVASRGGVVAGVLRDGDWNIAQKWLGDNGLRTNPDEKTYDPDALNWINASDYLDAAEKYISGYTETRPVVRNGKRTGETKTIKVDGVVTWTPGDVNIATKKGGLVSIVSTKEYSAQMPNVIIGIDKWMKSNRPTVEGMLLAITQGGDQVRTNPEALKRGAAVSAAVYNESGAGADYWEKYYKGVTENDVTGQSVELGGSIANNLADNLILFGLTPGAANAFAATYTVFGELVVAQYPELVPSIDPVDRILDTSYLKALATRNAPATQKAVTVAKPKFDEKKPLKQVVSNRRWDIPFETGRAVFSPAASKVLERMYRDLLVAGGTVIEIHGHTDSVGDPNGNLKLSEDRAFAVQSWLQRRSPVNFPEGRIRVFPHGQQNPVASNSTDAGRAKNRRVEVKIGTTGA